MSRARRPSIAHRAVVPDAYVVGTPRNLRIAEQGQPPPTVTVALISDDGLFVTKGRADGMRVGECYEIRAIASVVIRDPETSEVLGEVQPVTACFRVDQVYERFARCSLLPGREHRLSVGSVADLVAG